MAGNTYGESQTSGSQPPGRDPSGGSKAESEGLREDRKEKKVVLLRHVHRSLFDFLRLLSNLSFFFLNTGQFNILRSYSKEKHSEKGPENTFSLSASCHD